MSEITDRLLTELIDKVKEIVRKEQSDRLRDVYLIGDIEKDTARAAIERLRELANDSTQADHALHQQRRRQRHRRPGAPRRRSGTSSRTGIEVTIIVQGMAYSMGSVVLQAASPGRRLCFPHSWIMIHEPAKWAGWQSTTAAAQHLDRLKQMQNQIYRILSDRSGKPLRQIIRDTKRTDFYLDATKAQEYGLIDGVLGPGVVADADESAVPPRPSPSRWSRRARGVGAVR